MAAKWYNNHSATVYVITKNSSYNNKWEATITAGSCWSDGPTLSGATDIAFTTTDPSSTFGSLGGTSMGWSTGNNTYPGASWYSLSTHSSGNKNVTDASTYSGSECDGGGGGGTTVARTKINGSQIKLAGEGGLTGSVGQLKINIATKTIDGTNLIPDQDADMLLLYDASSGSAGTHRIYVDNLFRLQDNQATALNIREGSTSYLKFVTTNSSEAITASVAISAQAITATAVTATSVDVSDGNITNVGDIDADSLSVADAAVGLNIDGSGANTTKFKVTMADNLADALNINEGGNSYLKFVTTDGSEKITVGKELDASGVHVKADRLTVSGDMFVQGTTTTMSASHLVVSDPLIGAGYASGSTGAAAQAGAAGDRGLVMGIAAEDAIFMGWDESASKIAFCRHTSSAGAGASAVVPNGYLNIRAAELSGSSIAINAGTFTVSSAGATVASSLDVSDGNITNVGDIDADSLSVADAAVGLNIDGSGANTTLFKMTMADNLADALNITEGSNSYLKFVTSDGSEKITLGKKLEAGSVEIEGSNFDINGGNVAALTSSLPTLSSPSNASSGGDAFVIRGADESGGLFVANVYTIMSGSTGDGLQISAGGALSIDPVVDLFFSGGAGAAGSTYNAGAAGRMTSDLLTASLSLSGSGANSGQKYLTDSLQVFLNGQLLTVSGSTVGNNAASASYDYRITASTNKVLLENALDQDDILTIKYLKK